MSGVRPGGVVWIREFEKPMSQAMCSFLLGTITSRAAACDAKNPCIHTLTVRCVWAWPVLFSSMGIEGD